MSDWVHMTECKVSLASVELRRRSMLNVNATASQHGDLGNRAADAGGDSTPEPISPNTSLAPLTPNAAQVVDSK